MKAINLLVYKMGRRRGTSTLCTANHFPMSRRHLKSLFFLHVFFILLFLVFFQAAVMGADKGSPAPNSLAWQMEELMKWLIETRKLVPEKETAGTPFYAIDSLDLTGSVDKNRFIFEMKGHVISKQPVLLPLFGPPDGVMLKNVTLNGEPAVVGFEEKDHYFVRTKEASFVVKNFLLPASSSFHGGRNSRSG